MSLPAVLRRPAASLVAAVVRLLRRSLRVRILGAPRLERGLREGGAFALLHGDQLLLTAALPAARPTALVGLSEDGALAAAVLAELGIPTVRGSSSRGAASALRALIRALREGRAAAVTVDGPRGPRGRAAPGLLHAAARVGARVYPVIAEARPCLRLSSWDRFVLPLPGARVLVLVGAPVAASGPDARDRVERSLAALGRRATRLLDARP